MTMATVVLLVFALTAILTGYVRRYALARSLVDVPNGRSSHLHPTPRGGGMAIAVVLLGAYVVAGLYGFMDGSVVLALVGGGALVSGIGWLDDHRDVAPAVRAAVHVLAAAWALAWIGGLPALETGIGTLRLGLAGHLLAALGIVWATNLFNFMDGIDGIAAGETASGALAAGLLLLMARGELLAPAALLLAGACAGFLLWNRAPARIFMGDVGSGLLGFLVATLAVASENAGAVPLLVWLVLFALFLVDATVTLLRRVVRGERWYEAHRSHAYQRAVRAGWTHGGVVAVVLAANVVLAAIAVLAFRLPELLLGGVVLSVGLGLALYVEVERRLPMGAETDLEPLREAPAGPQRGDAPADYPRQHQPSGRGSALGS